jgi:16S rRNA (cytosine1402-N4)-methyltransferase
LVERRSPKPKVAGSSPVSPAIFDIIGCFWIVYFMYDKKISHVPVMLDEMLYYLNPKDNEHYVDLTFGAGGYTKSILEKTNNAIVTAIDRDYFVLPFAENLTNLYKERFKFINTEFSKVKQFISENSIDGVVLDFGISSMQVDVAERGFSFSKKAKLDMRMSNHGICAYDVINNFSETDIANIIFEYGGERDSRKIARSIVIERKITPIEDTIRFASIIKRAKKLAPSKIDPATKTFQAIRIFVNNELEEIKILLEQLDKILKIGARILFVSFHELEDRLIKNYLKSNEIKKLSTSKYKEQFSEEGIYHLLSKKAIRPSSEEVKNNPRSRSSILRAAIKIR